MLDIIKGEPAEHPHYRNVPSAVRPVLVDWRKNADPKPIRTSTIGPYQIVDRMKSTKYEIDLMQIDNALVRQAWDSVRDREDLESDEKFRTVIMQLARTGGNDVGLSAVSASPPAAADSSFHDVFARAGTNGNGNAASFATVQAAPAPAYPAAATPHPMFTAATPEPRPALSGPPQIAVDIFLDGVQSALRYYYHEIRRQGGYLYLILDCRYPGVARFPVDHQDRPFTIVPVGHATAFRVLSAGNQLDFGDHSISSLIVEAELPAGG